MNEQTHTIFGYSIEGCDSRSVTVGMIDVVTPVLIRPRSSSGVRMAEIIVICPVRSSKGGRNEEKCIMTIVGDFVSVLKGRSDIVHRYEKEIEIGGQMIYR